MGTNDYDARKQNKKARKRATRLAYGGGHGDKGGSTEKGAKRIRQKKNRVRALCRGACYKDPVITAEDREWDLGGEEDGAAPTGAGYESPTEDAAELSERQRSHHAASGSGADVPRPAKQLQKQQPTADDLGAPDQVLHQRDALKLSTAVRLLDPAEAAEQSASASAARRANKQRAAARSAGGEAPAAAPGAAPASGSGKEVPEALRSWPPLVQQFMSEQGFVEPTPIQEQCWPLASAGRDVQGVAEPGSGKTMAYLLPGAMKLLALGHSGYTQPAGPLMLVLLPTRELAIQVAGQCRLLRKLTGLRSACVYGGVPREGQAELLRAKCPHILAATPGRLLDLMDAGDLPLGPATVDAEGKATGGVHYVVLDEADRMLNLGWAPQLDRLRSVLLAQLAAAPVLAAAAAPAAAAKPAALKKGKNAAAAKAMRGEAQPIAAVAATAAASTSAAVLRAQVLLFTATMPDAVAGAAAAWLAPGAAKVEARHSADSISRTITQVVQVCAEHKKAAKLIKYLTSVRTAAAGLRQPPRVLVFANKIPTVRAIADGLIAEGFKATILHGKRSQTERDAAIRDFKCGKAPILVATDVASRGLDVRCLPYVVNYDFPPSLDTYIHRVGRTGRLAAHGHAFSFFTRNLACLSEPLVGLLNHHGQSVDPNLLTLGEAWSVAAAKLGDKAARLAVPAEDSLGDGTDEEEDEDEPVAAAPTGDADATEDLLEGLGGVRRGAAALAEPQKLSHKGIWGAAAVARGAVDGDGEQPEGKEEAREAVTKRRREATAAAAAAADAKVAAKRPKKAAAAAPVVAPAPVKAAPVAQPAFAASAKFTGARPGCAFKLGPQGLGYYKDRAPVVSKKLLSARGQPIVPLGPAGGAKDWGSDDSGGGSDDDDVGGRKREDSDGVSDDSDDGGGGGKRGGRGGRGARGGRGGRGGRGASPGRGGGAAAGEGRGRGGKRKAVPGRMRKKLAREGK